MNRRRNPESPDRRVDLRNESEVAVRIRRAKNRRAKSLEVAPESVPRVGLEKDQRADHESDPQVGIVSDLQVGIVSDRDRLGGESREADLVVGSRSVRTAEVQNVRSDRDLGALLEVAQRVAVKRRQSLTLATRRKKTETMVSEARRQRNTRNLIEKVQDLVRDPLQVTEEPKQTDMMIKLIEIRTKINFESMKSLDTTLSNTLHNCFDQTFKVLTYLFFV